MRTLYLLRHAKSSWDDETLSDFDRPLKKRGREAAKLVGQLIRKEKLRDLFVVCSPAQRTRETTRIVLKHASLDPEVRFDPQIYEAELAGLLEVLGRIESEHERVMIVGHNPGMENLLRLLTGASREMTTAALAKIKLDTESWRSLSGSEGHLDWLKAPREDD
jgi:phosphohistidine phosphatase